MLEFQCHCMVATAVVAAHKNNYISVRSWRLNTSPTCKKRVRQGSEVYSLGRFISKRMQTTNHLIVLSFVASKDRLESAPNSAGLIILNLIRFA